MYFVYALYSEKFNRIYIGHTQNIEVRLAEHNRGKVKTTKAFKPYKVIYSESFKLRSDAILREKELKLSRGRRFLRKYISGEAQTS